MGKECKDHLGNTYASISDMCKFWCLNRSTYRKRMKNGYSVKDALTTPRWLKKCDKIHTDKTCRQLKQPHRPHSQPVYDHIGIYYTNEKNMCEHYGIPYKTFRMRYHYKKWSLEKALLEPVNSKKNPYNVCDHLGNQFNSIREMLNYYHNDITNVAYRNRLMYGWTKEEAITIPKDMYIGEYRVSECLKRLHVKYYHDCQMKQIVKDFNISIDWDIFLNELKHHLTLAGVSWSKKKIEKLRPDFVLYTDDEDKIRGVIEFDGEQHQNFVEYFFKTLEEFFRRSNADFVKQSLWEYLHIPMLRIRHDQVDMIDAMVKDFLDNPQCYIHNHNTYLTEDEYWSKLTETKKQIDFAFAS